MLQSDGITTKGSVLIVEDDPVARKALAAIIEQAGYQTCAVETVAEALTNLEGQACAIVDMNLPDGLGTCVLRRIRDEGHPVRTAVLTGASDEAVLRWAVKYGAEIVMQKPVVVAQLMGWLCRPRGGGTPSAACQHA